MDPIVTAALISGGSSLLGGLMGKSSNKDSLRFAAKSALYGIRWRTADAKAAGIHPLAALGISPASGPSSTYNVETRESVGKALEAAGQNIANMVSRMKTKEDKIKERLENNLLKSQANMYDAIEAKNLADANQAMRNSSNGVLTGNLDAFGIMGQGGGPSLDVPVLRYKPAEQVVKKGFGTEAGLHAAERHYTLGRNTVVEGPTPDVGESSEDDLYFKVQKFAYKAGNHGLRVRGLLYGNKEGIESIIYGRPKESPGKGMMWKYQPLLNTYKRAPIGDGSISTLKMRHKSRRYKKVKPGRVEQFIYRNSY